MTVTVECDGASPETSATNVHDEFFYQPPTALCSYDEAPIVNATSEAFGNFAAPGGSASKTITVCFGFEYQLTSIGLLAGSDPGFSLDSATCQPQQAGPFTCTITVTFTSPTAISPPLVRRAALGLNFECTQAECPAGTLSASVLFRRR